jgi:hypothetical protein
MPTSLHRPVVVAVYEGARYAPIALFSIYANAGDCPMTDSEMQATLSRADAYALARALVGLSRSNVPVSPLVSALLTRLDLDKPAEVHLLRRILGPDLIRQVLAEDPNSEPPTSKDADFQVAPELPAAARLTMEQAQEAERVGNWLRDYVSWAGAAANETPLLFHQGAGLYLAAVAIGRRLFINTPWRQQVFPNLYVMLVAVSTYYRKSAGLSLASQVARAAMPHMILPQPGSPENFMNMLGGILPPNFDTIPAPDRERLTKGNVFAAQRGILRDELSALFKSMGRDYMAGVKELIMQLYDCPAYLDSNTNNRGLVVIHDTALSILGAATPAELACALTVNDWYNGNLARFVLLTPEPEYAERPAQTESVSPDGLVARLRRLHETLPPPPSPNAIGEKPQAEAWSLVAGVWEHCHAYEQALRKMTAPDSALDDRLRAVYGRLHVQALKVAMILAALDWTDEGANGRPVVRAAHWFRAQQIVETWRASAHRLLHDLGESEESRLEVRIIRLLKAHPEGLTLRSIYKGLKATRKPVLETLHALEQDSQVRRTTLTVEGKPGPRPDVYVWAD